MTEKLKTLRDLKHLVKREEGTPDYEAVDLLTLRAEAVKDYKDDEEMYPNIFNTIEQQEAVRRYIKWKFNLTEEEIESICPFCDMGVSSCMCNKEEEIKGEK